MINIYDPKKIKSSIVRGREIKTPPIEYRYYRVIIARGSAWWSYSLVDPADTMIEGGGGRGTPYAGSVQCSGSASLPTSDALLQREKTSNPDATAAVYIKVLGAGFLNSLPPGLPPVPRDAYPSSGHGSNSSH